MNRSGDGREWYSKSWGRDGKNGLDGFVRPLLYSSVIPEKVCTGELSTAFPACSIQMYLLHSPTLKAAHVSDRAHPFCGDSLF
jgi:hypothetical protein